MKVKINRNAAKELKKALETEEAAQGRMIRIYVSEIHGDHAHYGISYDTPQEHDEIVKTDKDLDILLDTRDEEWFDGIWIQYFYVGPRQGFVITNPSKGGHVHH